MAKAKQSKKPQSRTIRNAVQEVTAEVVAATVQQPAPVIVVVGGSKGKAVTENAAMYAAVTPAQMSEYGASKKTVLRGLAMNLMAGTTLDKAFFDRENDTIWTRDLRTEKTAFFYLCEKSNRQEIVKAWETALAGRKRYDAPTLQSLSKSVRRFKLLGADSEVVSPMERFARKIIAALVDSKLTDAERIRTALVLLREKSGEVAQPAAMPGAVLVQGEARKAA